jgi:dTDP-4-dehydrorhamnose 3,5-epimerase
VKFTPTRISDVVLVEPAVFADERGFFMESWQQRRFATHGIDATFVQDNHSASDQWVLRGLHYQLRRPQGKLVRVVVGEVFDVAVDLRSTSATCGRWVAQRLSAANRQMLWIPPGFAHGFLVLSERAELLYKCTDFYDPGDERTLRWDDAQLAIEWPLPSGVQPIVSTKDREGKTFGAAELPA